MFLRLTVKTTFGILLMNEKLKLKTLKMKKIFQKNFRKRIALSIALTVLIGLLFSCHKSDWFNNNVSYVQNEAFFKRNDTLKEFYAQINGSLADNALLGKVIEHFKDFDNRAKILNEVEKKYGKAFWDISFVLRDFNGLRTVVTPIINNADTVTALIFSSERNSDYTYFRIIDKQTKQTKLREYGDKNATLFTLQTLKGLFSATQSNYNYAKNNAPTISSSNKIVTNSISINTILAITTCWTYTYTTGTYIYNPYDNTWGYVPGDLFTYTQCSTNYVYIDTGGDSSSTGLGNSTPSYSGGGGSGTSGGTTNNPPANPTQGNPDSIINKLAAFPCAQDILRKLPNLNNYVSNMLKNTFGVNQNVNIDYIVDNTLGAGVNAFTTTDSVKLTENGNTVFVAVVRLNESELQNASKELIAAIIFHESTHAFLEYMWGQYINGRITAEYMQTNFPLIWQYQDAGNSEHFQMVDKFTTALQGAIRSYNPNLSDSAVFALGYSGLPMQNQWCNLDPATKQSITDFLKLAKKGDPAEMTKAKLTLCPF